MTNLVEKFASKQVSRRDFLKLSATASAGLALMSNRNVLAKVGSDFKLSQNEEGKWLSAACWHNCGGRCLNKVLVKDGVVVRQKTDDTHPDSIDYPQQRSCLRGHSQRKQVFAADRLKYPMKRKHWEPGGGDKSLRGRDEWVRISWEEALDLVAGEIKRIVQNYGNRAIYAPGGDEIFRTLALYGGFTHSWGTTSIGNWILAPSAGSMGFTACINDRYDIRNSDTVIMLGMNPSWNAGGSPSYLFNQLKNPGAKYIAIDPFYNDTYAMLDAEWIPVYPGSDIALLLGVAHVMITEDDPIANPLIDWDFLKRCTIGFDAESIPEGEDSKENFKDYVLGIYDGIAKTPEWASERCGAKPEKIKKLAYAFGKNNKVAFMFSFASAKAKNSENLPQLFMTIGAMGGHFGKSGHMVGLNLHTWASNGGPDLVTTGGIPSVLPVIENPIDDKINDAVAWKSILEGKYNYTGGLGWNLPSEIRDIDIRMIYHGGLNQGNWGIGVAGLQTKPDMTNGIEVHRKVEFVVSHSHFLTTNSKYADIVLPVTTQWERVGTLENTHNREAVFMYSQITEPLYEARDDRWIAIEIAKRLGIDEKAVFPFDAKQQYYNEIALCKVITEDGLGYEPLVSITDSDIAEWGVNGDPQQGKISLKEFEEKGVYQVPRKPGDNFGYIAYKDFVEDPIAHPLGSESGKIEIYCKYYKNGASKTGYGEISPIPKYMAPIEGYEETFVDWENKIKGDYPYQVINPHYLRRSHSTLDNVGWLREAFPNPLFINASDAKEKGIQDGDTVLLTNQYGKTLRQACVTERYMPGVIGLPHGSWVDIDEKTGIDTGGADNILVGHRTSGIGLCAFMSCLVNMEKYNGAPNTPDVQKPPRIINLS